MTQSSGSQHRYSTNEATFALLTISRSRSSWVWRFRQGEVAADHAALFFVAGVVGAVEGEAAQRGEVPSIRLR
jgi:hypothetical protein